MVLVFSTLIALVASFLTTVYFLLYHFRRLRLYTNSFKFPGPWALPIIGNAHFFMGKTEDIFDNFVKLFNTYESPFRVWIVNRLFYFISDPEQLKIVLNSPKTIDKDEIYKVTESWVGKGLFTAPAAKWRVHRKLIAPTFNQRILDSFVEVFSEQSMIMCKKLECEVNTKEIDVFHYVSLCTVDIICETAMGLDSKAQEEKSSPYIDLVKKLGEVFVARMFTFWLKPDFIFYRTQLGKEERLGVEHVHAITYNLIKKKKQALMLNNNVEDNVHLPGDQIQRKAFLDLLMEGTNFTDEELREEVDTMMVAGSDTTASINTFVILMLASHPEIQEKVYQEIYEIYGATDPKEAPVTTQDLNRMPYLENVIKETMRLFPVGPFLARRLTDDLNIGKHTLVKGGAIIFSIINLHRNKKYWKDPLKFDPDRFLPEESAKRHPYCYLPFSGGPRNCLGKKYAMMSMKALLATLLRSYILKKDNIVPIKDIRLKVDVMMKPLVPVTIRIEKRLHRN